MNDQKKRSVLLSATLAALCGLWMLPSSIFATTKDELVARWRIPDYDGVTLLNPLSKL